MLAQRWANVGVQPLGQRWANWQIHVGPTLVSRRWPNVRVDVGPTLGQRRNASWDTLLLSLQNMVDSIVDALRVPSYLTFSWYCCHIDHRNGISSLPLVSLHLTVKRHLVMWPHTTRPTNLCWDFNHIWYKKGLKLSIAFDFLYSFQDSRYVPGAGATEIELAKQISQYGEVRRQEGRNL